MQERSLERVRDDLAVMRQAAGLELPFGREDVHLNLAVGAGGALGLAWVLLVRGQPAHWGLVPLVLVAVICTMRRRIEYRRSTGRSGMRRREYTAAIVLAVLVGGLALVYRVWGTRLGIARIHLQAVSTFFLGLACLWPAVIDRRRWSYAALAIPLLVCGLAMPLVPASPVALFCGAMLVAGPAMGAVQAWQLRRSRAGDATD